MAALTSFHAGSVVLPSCEWKRSVCRTYRHHRPTVPDL